MDNTKQEAIDMLLHSNSYSGELGLKAKALLDPTDALGEEEEGLVEMLRLIYNTATDL